MRGIFFSLGSNLGNRKKNLERGCLLLEKMGIRILKRSRIYETEPVGFSCQPRFFNMVIEGETEKSPEECLSLIKKIEQKMGRIRLFKNSPRTLDIDLLFYDQSVIEEKDLKVPHPEIPRREFVLKPLAEIAPDFCHPQLKKKIKELLRQLQCRKES